MLFFFNLGIIFVNCKLRKKTIRNIQVTDIHPPESKEEDASWRSTYEQEREIERQAILYRIRETHQHHQDLKPHQVSGLAIQILTNPDYLEEVVQAYVSRVGNR